MVWLRQNHIEGFKNKTRDGGNLLCEQSEQILKVHVFQHWEVLFNEWPVKLSLLQGTLSQYWTRASSLGLVPQKGGLYELIGIL